MAIGSTQFCFHYFLASVFFCYLGLVIPYARSTKLGGEVKILMEAAYLYRRQGDEQKYEYTRLLAFLHRISPTHYVNLAIDSGDLEKIRELIGHIKPALAYAERERGSPNARQFRLMLEKLQEAEEQALRPTILAAENVVKAEEAQISDRRSQATLARELTTLREAARDLRADNPELPIVLNTIDEVLEKVNIPQVKEPEDLETLQDILQFLKKKMQNNNIDDDLVKKNIDKMLL